MPDERGLGRRVSLRTLSITACLVVAAVSLYTAAFTTVDHQEAGTYDCGSPIDPPDGRFTSVAPTGDHGVAAIPLGQCKELLDHARATRTAALVWLSASLALLCLIMWTDREPRTGVKVTDDEDEDEASGGPQADIEP